MSKNSGNNSNESGLLIYNKVNKASSTTVASYMLKFAAFNNYTNKFVPFQEPYMIKTQKEELTFLSDFFLLKMRSLKKVTW